MAFHDVADQGPMAEKALCDRISLSMTILKMTALVVVHRFYSLFRELSFICSSELVSN